MAAISRASMVYKTEWDQSYSVGDLWEEGAIAPWGWEKGDRTLNKRRAIASKKEEAIAH